jgi:type VI secretion system secreted protein Hcp
MDLILLEPGDQAIFGGIDHDSSPLDGMRWPVETPGLNLPTGRCIELVSLHQGMKQQVTTDSSNSARTSGRPVITEFTCVKYVDKTSVKFYDYCLRAATLGGGKNPAKIYIVRNSGDKTANIMTFELRDALISEIQLQSHPDDMPTEQFKLNFTEIIWTYSVQGADGHAAGRLSSGWSIARNRPISKFSE